MQDSRLRGARERYVAGSITTESVQQESCQMADKEDGEKVILARHEFELATEIVADLEKCNSIYLQKIENKKTKIQELTRRLEERSSSAHDSAFQDMVRRLQDEVKVAKEEKMNVEYQYAVLQKSLVEQKKQTRAAEERRQNYIRERDHLDAQLHESRESETKVRMDAEQARREAAQNASKCILLESRISQLEEELAIKEKVSTAWVSPRAVRVRSATIAGDGRGSSSTGNELEGKVRALEKKLRCDAAQILILESKVREQELQIQSQTVHAQLAETHCVTNADPSEHTEETTHLVKKSSKKRNADTIVLICGLSVLIHASFIISVWFLI